MAAEEKDAGPPKEPGAKPAAGAAAETNDDAAAHALSAWLRRVLLVLAADCDAVEAERFMRAARRYGR